MRFAKHEITSAAFGFYTTFGSGSILKQPFTEQAASGGVGSKETQAASALLKMGWMTAAWDKTASRYRTAMDVLFYDRFAVPFHPLAATPKLNIRRMSAASE